MIITTKRLVLRPVERADAPRFVVLCNDADIARNTARIPQPYTEEDAANFVERATRAAANGDEYVFAVTCDNEIIACAGAMPMDDGAFELGSFHQPLSLDFYSLDPALTIDSK